MKHASAQTLTILEPLLARLRAFATLRERKPGTFYRGGSAFLHFHEDPAGIFADVKIANAGFTRVSVATADQQAKLLEMVRKALGAPER